MINQSNFLLFKIRLFFILNYLNIYNLILYKLLLIETLRIYSEIRTNIKISINK